MIFVFWVVLSSCAPFAMPFAIMPVRYHAVRPRYLGNCDDVLGVIGLRIDSVPFTWIFRLLRESSLDLPGFERDRADS